MRQLYHSLSSSQFHKRQSIRLTLTLDSFPSGSSLVTVRTSNAINLLLGNGAYCGQERQLA